MKPRKALSSLLLDRHVSPSAARELGRRGLDRGSHGVHCTGGCSWKIDVKSGVVTWGSQQTDYPRTRARMPNHEPRIARVDLQGAQTPLVQ